MQAQAFTRLGITQAQVQAGQKDMLPLLMSIADRFHAMGAGVQTTGLAMQLFSRGGAAMVPMLLQGSAGMKQLFEEANKLGLVIGTDDVVANEKYKASMHVLHSELEAMAVTVGRHVIPVLTELMVRIVASDAVLTHHAEQLKQGRSWIMAWAGAWDAGNKAADEFRTKIEALAKSLAKFGDESGGGLTDAGKVEEAKSEYSGLADALERVKAAAIDTSSVDERTRKEYEGLTAEIGKAIKKYDELRAAGKLTADDAKAEAAALASLPGALLSLLNRYAQEVEQKNQQAGEELREQTLRQGEQTMAVRVALLDLERKKRLEKMREQLTDTAENLAEESKLYQAELDKIATTEISVLGKAQETLNAKIAALGEQTLGQKRLQFNQAVDADFAALSKDLQQNETIQNLIVAYKQAGLAKIDADAKSAGDAEVARLGEQLQRIERVHETSAERIAAEYQADVAKYVAAEEKKSLATAVGEAQRAQIVAMFAAAAIWGSVGAAAAVAGRAVDGGSSGAGAAGTGPGGKPGVGQYGSQTAAQQADQRGVSAPAAASGPHVTVNVQGHLVGWTNIGQLTDALSDAVLNSGHTLTATNTRTGKQIQQ